MTCRRPSRITISLRGSLADDFAHLVDAGCHTDPTRVLEELLSSGDPDVIILARGDTLLIGRLSERGTFLPDW